jgi:hypothetical protein
VDAVNEGPQEAVAEAAEYVADQAEAVAQVVRGLTKVKLQFAALGAVAGATAAAITTYYIVDRRLTAKYNQIASDEIAEMREHYQDKARALEATVAKPDLEDLVREQGYVSEAPDGPPMAVEPPPAIVEAAQTDDETVRVETLDEHRARLRREAVEKDPQLRNVFEEHAPAEPPPAEQPDEWVWEKELAKRSPLTPYIIHTDERSEFDHYADISLTYYEVDDVLTNERDEIIPDSDRERMIGENSLNRFGHGSGDPEVVFVRNDPLETMFEIVRSSSSYAEEVRGLSHSDHVARIPRRRQRFDDESPSG